MSDELAIDVPMGEEMPVVEPGGLLTLYKVVDGKEGPGRVRVKRIEGRRIVFENVEVH